MMQKLLLGLFMSVGITGCSQGKSCTEIGCEDTLSISLRTSDNRWDEGDYVLTLIVGEMSTKCSWNLPDDFPPVGSAPELNCEPSIGYRTAALNQVSTCQETTTGDAVSQSCTPVAGEYTLDVQLQGTPSTVEVKLERDDTSLVDRTLAPTYEASRPNGPECGPVCRVASIVVDVP